MYYNFEATSSAMEVKYRQFSYSISNGSVSVSTYICKLRKYLTTTNTTSYNVTSDYHPAHKKYVDAAINNLTPSVTNGTFVVEAGDNTTGASGTWKVNKIGKMCVLDIELNIPIGNDVAGCQFKTEGLNPIPNGLYGIDNQRYSVAVNKIGTTGVCQIIGYNTSQVSEYQPRIQLIYFTD